MAQSVPVTSQLTAEHAETIKATLPLVGSRIDEIAPTFYRRMFSAHPELLRDTFNRGNQAQGAQQKALAASVATFATILVNPDGPSADDLLSRIGHKHISLGITEDQYQIVHDNLMAAIVEVLGADVVTAPVAEAWDEVYWIMARTLIRFENAGYRAAGVEPGKVFLTAQVARRIEQGEGVATFELVAREGEPELVGFLPGQYISVRRTMADGAGQLRQYSLCNAPTAGRWQITVKKVTGTPDGEVSSSIIDGLHEGDELEVTLPTGDLVLDQASDAPVVLISAGIGATPMLGMARALADEKSERTVLVLHADQDAAGAALVDELTEAAKALPNGRITLWFEKGEHELATLGLMQLDQVELPEGAQYYLCGSNGFLQAVRTQLLAKGIAAEDVHFELFSPNDWLLPA
ncbi:MULTISPECIES: globin domain-containing protein [unclassified Luteococcus]|uniref:globin domain-containing protein n=1 Tax=unclassified Luteococcus TaxID=2639923 RepID=UPI00313DEA86